MSGFASSVMLGDLNDFISPSQACVNPIFSDSANAAAPSTVPSEDGDTTTQQSRPKISLAFESDISASTALETQAPNLIKTTAKKTAKVSLTDCLACSGCVTSAETVLIQQQSIEEFKAALAKNAAEGSPKTVVATISAQSLSSLATFYQSTRLQTWERITQTLKSVGVHKVVSAQLGGDIALVESTSEFLHRYRSSAGSISRSWEPTRPSVAVSKSETHYPPEALAIGDVEIETTEQPPMYSQLPMLASSCPGWICFAEKTHPEAIPYIGTTKSPQQMMGAMVKALESDHQVYHVTVMPCPDKKLEGARKDFFDGESNDVDCVLTTSELADLLNENTNADSDNINNEMEVDDDNEMETENGCKQTTNEKITGIEQLCNFNNELAVSSRAGSGGYLEYLFRKSAKELYGVELATESPLPYKRVRNKDFLTVELQVDGKTVLNFAAVYGFRNIQAIIRQLKRGTCPYHYVEIMACPGGCLNGGGQPALVIPETQGAVATARAKNAKLEELEINHHKGIVVRDPMVKSAVETVYKAIGGGKPLSDQARQVFHTRYHAVPKLVSSLLERW